MNRPSTLRSTAVALLVALAGLGLDTDPLAAQSCFRGRPLPECESFWITELTWNQRLNDSPDPEKAGFYFVWELGRMANRDERTALGWTVHLGADDNGTRLGARVRARRWLGRRTSLELAPGVVAAASDNILDVRIPGLTAQGSLNLADVGALVVQVELLRYTVGEPFRERVRPRGAEGVDVAWYVGARAGSHAGLAATSALAVVFIVAMSTMGPIGPGGS